MPPSKKANKSRAEQRERNFYRKRVIGFTSCKLCPARAISGGSAGMNVTSGGPHILLFERDQQLTGLLSGELALAGYEVHTARTAVEVFDAIARFPIRLVMVNLAQAQAGRREFWVALDAQRRGRGVQVFTFRCANVGGYGPDDPEERVETVLTDLEVEGMMGIVKLVDAVRARVPGSVATTSSPPPPRPAQVPTASMQEDLYRQGSGRFIE